VLVLSNYYREPDVREKYRAAAALGADLVVATAEGAAELEGGVRYAAVKTTGTADQPADLTWHPTTLKRLFSDERPDLVHIEADPESPLAAAGSRIARALACPYAVFSWRALRPRLGWIARRRGATVLEHAAGVIGGSRAAMDLLVEAAPAAIATVLPLAGTPAAPQPRVPTGAELAIGFAGRLIPERGADDLVAALGKTFGKWRLVIAGTGPEQEALETHIQRLGLASRVRWLGGLRRESLTTLWEEIDCLVAPSRDTPSWVEYHSPVLLEAMGHGIAPIVTRAGCLPDVVGDGGVIVDDIESLPQVLQEWVANPAVAHAYGLRARQRVMDRFITSAVATRTLEFWRAMLDHAATLHGASARESA
jgi:glycosyltransferase involved in cell wall biosynthesis